MYIAMNQSLLQKLRDWRNRTAQIEGVDSFRVFPNKTLDDIARSMPTSKEELTAIKGIKEKKFEKYGREILAILKEFEGGSMVEKENVSDKNKVYTVSGYLDFLNAAISREIFTIQGEVSSVSIKGQVYFSIKDKEDESLLNCFMWNNVYQMCGIEIVEGMEIIVRGVAEVYKPYGKLTFKVGTVELVGEGALKKAYDKLKAKLEADGLFAQERKKPIPIFPHRIGLITSRDGAVINDFMSNIGRFGYKIIFMDSRVEGMGAISDLIGAVDYFSDKDIDVLVIIRGGGSLESLQAFNNEMLVRKVASLKMPVLCGIGHDKDVPLLSYVADRAVSTPTAVAQNLNKSWEQALEKVNLWEKTIIFRYEESLKDIKYDLNNFSTYLINFYESIFRKFEIYEQGIKNIVLNFNYILNNNRSKLEKTSLDIRNFYESIIERFDECGKEIKKNISNIEQIIRLEKYKIQSFRESISVGFKNIALQTEKELNNYEKRIKQNSPERQLKLGYSIVTYKGKIIKSIKQVKEGDLLVSKFSDGKIKSEAKEISINNN